MSNAGNAHGFPVGWQDWVQRELDGLVSTARSRGLKVEIESITLTPQLRNHQGTGELVVGVTAKMCSLSGWQIGQLGEAVQMYKFYTPVKVEP